MSKIIWVDDDAGSVLAGLGRFLRRRGFSVETATNFETARHLLETREYDAILLDLILPKGGGEELLDRFLGIELARKFRERETSLASEKPRIPIVVLTVLPADEFSEIARELDLHFISKTELLDRSDELVAALGG